MNIFNFVFGVCNNFRKDNLSNSYKKDSKIISGINNNKKQREEILSTDTTNNLEIIEYPYSNNINEGINLQMETFDYYKGNDKNEVQNILGDLDDCNILNNNDYNRRNSINNSSEVINNEDNLSKNKALLINYYSNNQNLKNKNTNNNNVNSKNNNINGIKNIGDNYIKESKEIDIKYIHIHKIGVKIDMPCPDSNSFISKKINNKSKSQGEIGKEDRNKKVKINLKKNQNLIKSNTNYIIFKKDNKDIKKNIILQKKRDINSNDKDKKNRVYNTNKIYTPINNCRNIPKKNIIKSKLQKKSIKGKNIFMLNNQFYKIMKNNNTFRYNENIVLNNNKSVIRNLVSSYFENEQNNLDFSYLWINNRGSNNSTKTILNPFKKIEIKKKKINKKRFSNKNNHLK